MSSILRRASSNFLKQHKSQLALTIFGIAIGVAVVVSVELAKHSALEAFDQAVRVVVGRATHRIIGGPGGLNDQLYTQLRLSGEVALLAPRVDGLAKYQDEQGSIIHLLGVDPMAEIEFGSDWYRSANQSAQGDAIDFGRLITEPGTVVVTRDTAHRLAIEKEQSFELLIGTQRKQVTLVGILSLQHADTEQALNDFLITDIATAQELLGMVGRLSYIDLLVKEGQNNRQQLEKIKALLPKDADLIVQGSGQRSVREMTRAFYANLTALSTLSLIVGMFLIYNTMTFLVVQRRQLIGRLRALGVTQRQIFQLILSEAALIGLIGTIVGLLAGIALSHVFLGLIGTTLDQTFFTLTSPALSISPLILAEGMSLGIGATILSAILPAVGASRFSPLQVMRRSQIESHTRSLVFRFTLGGILVLIIGAGILLIPTKSIGLGFIGQLILVIGFAMLTPVLTVTMMAFIRPIFARMFGVMGYLPARFVTASLSRTGVAISALMVAIAISIGLQLMVGSFRLSVFNWLEQRLDAELYISNPAPASSAAASGLSLQLVQRIQKLPGVTAVSTVHRVSIKTKSEVTRVNVYQMAPVTFAGFRFTQGSPDQIWEAFEHDDAVIVTEAYAYLHNVQVGNRLKLRTERGERDFRLVGIYTDYNSGRGIVSMSRRTFDRYWDDHRYSGIWVYAEEGSDLDVLRTQVRNISDSGQTLQITEQKRIIELSMDIFDQAFAITDVLRYLAATIAFVGVFGALMALELERTREFGILRANGITPGQLRTILCAETGFMGFIAGTLALPLACCIAWILIFVVNRRSFGWSMDFTLDPGVLAQGFGLALLAAVLAGIYPANKMAKLKPADALRTE